MRVDDALAATPSLQLWAILVAHRHTCSPARLHPTPWQEAVAVVDAVLVPSILPADRRGPPTPAHVTSCTLCPDPSVATMFLGEFATAAGVTAAAFMEPAQPTFHTATEEW
jgi:hypothetical protein